MNDSLVTDYLYGDYQNNTIYTDLSDQGDFIDGGTGIDTVVYSELKQTSHGLNLLLTQRLSQA